MPKKYCGRHKVQN